ncbi:MAG: hypothetical protein HYY65_03475 [Candidatus Tectomicrobia bacterium]|uniref:Uncharacterized protein n=1 Tax=Tectimicrobiota bacterium TaxID=2528274 RepID=A0A932GNJ4_UNCTE|nr:hypothetical protein [Candidatus Tectomicrobia bacterium]
MTLQQKYVLWMTGVFVAVHAISIGLSTWYFGYMDRAVVAQMAQVLLPAVMIAGVLFHVYRRRSEATEAGSQPVVAGRVKFSAQEVRG